MSDRIQGSAWSGQDRGRTRRAASLFAGLAALVSLAWLVGRTEAQTQRPSGAEPNSLPASMPPAPVVSRPTRPASPYGGTLPVQSKTIAEPRLTQGNGQPKLPAEKAPVIPPKVPDKGKGADELPPPRPGIDLGPDRIRLPRLPGVPGPLGTTPVPTAKDLEEYNQFIEGV